MSTANELLVAACTSRISCLDEMNLLRVIAQGAMSGGGGGGGPFVLKAGDTMTGALILPVGSAAAPSLGVGGTTSGLFRPAVNQLGISTAGVQRMMVTAAGLVGIGIASPAAKLDVFGFTKTGFGVASNSEALMVNQPSGSSTGIQLFQDGVESWTVRSPASSTSLVFEASGAERVRITTIGNVGIGTTSPTAILHLKAGTAAANTAPLKMTAGTLLATPEIGTWEFTDDGTTAHAYVTVRIATVVTRVQLA